MLTCFRVPAIFFPPCKPSRSETYVSASVKEIDYVQLGIVNQAELKLQPRAFFSFCTAAYTEDKLVLPLSIQPAVCISILLPSAVKQLLYLLRNTHAVAPDAFPTRVILDVVNQETLLEVPIEYNSVIFEGSLFSSVDMKAGAFQLKADYQLHFNFCFLHPAPGSSLLELK
ncbi:hypothetical protein Tco_1508629 [Tanacetum coccineum]